MGFYYRPGEGPYTNTAQLQAEIDLLFAIAEEHARQGKPPGPTGTGKPVKRRGGRQPGASARDWREKGALVRQLSASLDFKAACKAAKVSENTARAYIRKLEEEEDERIRSL